MIQYNEIFGSEELNLRKDNVMPRKALFFIITESILYLLFLFLDLQGISGSTWIKYAGVLLAVCFAFRCASRMEDYLTALALFFTAAADFFLLVLNRHYETGVLIFCLVQFLYCLRLSRPGTFCSKREVALRIALPVPVVFLLAGLGQASLLNILAAFYFCNLVINAAKSRVRRGWNLFTIGLILFICCDICVGLFNLLPPACTLFPFAALAMWAFYLPSQVLLALSTIDYRKEISS